MMRALSLELKGYKAIYNGMNRTEIFLDFSNFNNKITLLKGSSGRGKSTIQSAMSLLPESNSDFIHNMDAEKKFTFMNILTNEIYTVHFIHNVKLNGSRESVRAYLLKEVNGSIVNLNPNGNLGSYKSVIENEFNMDLGFLTFSRITNENKGLVEKTPSERRKCINILLKDTEIYDSMNKKSTALYNQYKGTINNIVEKLNKITEPEIIQESIDVHSKELDFNKNKLDNLNITKGEYIGKINMIDPDGNIMARYNDIKKSLDDIYQKNIANVDINVINDKKNRLSDNENAMMKLNLEMDKLKVSIDHLQDNLKDKSERKMYLTSKLDSLNVIDISNIEMKKTVLEDNMKRKMEVISKMGIDDINSISGEDYITAINTIHDIENVTDDFLSSYDSEVIDHAISCFKYNKTISTVHLYDELVERKEYLSKIEYQISDRKRKRELMSILDKRPSDCMIDTCEFIKSALEIKNELNDEDDFTLECEKARIEDAIIYLREFMDFKEKSKLALESLHKIKNYIKSNVSIFEKINYIPKVLKDVDLYIDNIKSYTFNDISQIYDNLSEVNIIEEYKNNMREMSEIDKMINTLEKDKSLIDEYLKEKDQIAIEISDIKYKINNATIKYNDLQSELDSIKNNNDDLRSDILKLETNILLLNNKIELENEYNSIINSINEINAIRQELEKIDNEIRFISNDIIPSLSQKLGILENDLLNYAEYTAELDNYNKEYEIISLIKKYSNPTGIGIQTIFMKYYMNSIIDSTNEYLAYFFNGEFSLLQDSGENPNEFKIPCKGNGILHDDISSMSFSQRCIVSMLISISLYRKSSDIYNILMLDEIDSGLDNIQRQIFARNIDNISEALGLTHVIITSHNNEFNESYCDIINLDDYAL